MSLDVSAVTFAVPRVIERGEEDGCHYTVEVRIPGTSLIEALPRLDGARRRDAFVAYADAAAEIGKVGCRRHGFGEIVAAVPIVASGWSDFVLARAEADLNRNRERVRSAVDLPDRAIDRLAHLLAGRPEVEPGLVHGDYHPADVMVDDIGRVTGVVDFSGLTLLGDPRLDMAASLLHLTGLEGIAASDRQVVLGQLRSHGVCEDDVALCRLHYAFRFLDTSRAGLIRWCLDTIRTAC